MRKNAILKLVKIIGSGKIKVTGTDWIMCQCPFAFITHSKKKDSNPSFGIKIDDSDASGYHCFTCGEKGSSTIDLVTDLVSLVEIAKQRGSYYPDLDLEEAFKIAEKYENELVNADEIPDYEDKVPTKPIESGIPEAWLQVFDLAVTVKDAVDYLKLRDVKRSACVRADLRYDEILRMVCIPIRTYKGVLVGMQGRAIDSDVEKSMKHKRYKFAGKSYQTNTMIGEHLIDFDSPVLIVEGGLIDYLKAIYSFPNTLSLSGVSKDISLLYNFPVVHTAFDSDKAGDDARSRFSRLENIGFQLKPPKGLDLGDLSASQIEIFFDPII